MSPLDIYDRSRRLSVGSVAPAPPAPMVSVPCAREGCNTVTTFPLGTLDPKQGACAHVFVANGWDGLRCTGCDLRVPGITLRAAGYVEAGGRYYHRASALADRCQELKDENTKLLVENARMRRGLAPVAIKRKK